MKQIIRTKMWYSGAKFFLIEGGKQIQRQIFSFFTHVTLGMDKTHVSQSIRGETPEIIVLDIVTSCNQKEVIKSTINGKFLYSLIEKST